MPNQDLINGIDALQAGKIPEARTSLIRTVRTDPDSQDGWFWLGQLLDDPERKRYCYLRVLSINPNNRHAWLALSQIGDVGAELPKPAMSNASPEEQIRQRLIESENIGAVSKQTSPILNWKSLLLGFLLSILLIVLPAGYIILQGYLDNYLIDSRKVDLPSMPMLIETWVDTYSPAAPLPIPDEPYEERYAKAEPIIVNATMLHEAGNYSDAIEEFSDALRYVPENPDVYFRRSGSSFSRISKQTSLLGRLYDLYMALSDMDRAIELQPDIGDYYAARGMIYYTWAGYHSVSVNNAELYKQALDNFTEASRLGYSDAYPVDLLQASALIESGQCEQALTTIRTYLEENDPESEAYIHIERLEPYVYTCMEDFDTAMNSLEETSQENALTAGEMRLKAIILYQQAKPEEALQVINTLTSLYPGFDSDHFYLRGLIYFENGNWEAAYNELMYRQAYNKTDVGLYVYVQGLMGMRLPGSLNREKSIAAFQYAEASISPLYPAIKEKIQDQLLSMGAGYEEFTPSIPQVTSLPVYTPLPTARPTQMFTSTPRATSQEEMESDSMTPGPTRMPSMPSVILLPPLEEVDSIVDLTTGSGAFSLAMGIDKVIRFQPEKALPIQKVNSLKVFLEGEQTQVEAPVLKLWNTRTGNWVNVDADWGSTTVKEPFEYVTPEGDVYLFITSQEKAILIDNIAIQLVILDGDDQTQRYGRR
jgi:tetratricopeptide (TPR) repeat protein